MPTSIRKYGSKVYAVVTKKKFAQHISQSPTWSYFLRICNCLVIAICTLCKYVEFFWWEFLGIQTEHASFFG